MNLRPTLETNHCRWWQSHQWTKWADKNEGEKYRDVEGVRRVIGKFIIQERRCERCNQVQLHLTNVDLA